MQPIPDLYLSDKTRRSRPDRTDQSCDGRQTHARPQHFLVSSADIPGHRAALSVFLRRSLNYSSQTENEPASGQRSLCLL